jgi:hypothetical protein
VTRHHPISASPHTQIVVSQASNFPFKFDAELGRIIRCHIAYIPPGSWKSKTKRGCSNQTPLSLVFPFFVHYALTLLAKGLESIPSLFFSPLPLLPFPFFQPSFFTFSHLSFAKGLWFQLVKSAEQGVLRGFASLFKKDR